MLFSKNDSSATNISLTKALAPSGIRITDDHIKIENYYMRYFTIVKYPDNATLKWLSTLNMSGITWSYHIGEIDLTKLIKQTNDNINQKEKQLERTKDAIVKQRILRDIRNANIMLSKMDSDTEKTVNFTIIIRVSASSLEELNKKSIKLKTRCATNKIPVKPVLFAQEGCFYKNIPLNLEVEIRYNNPMPVSTISAGFPFLNNYINDEEGILLGKDGNFNNVIVNFWNKTKTRFNSNIVVIGDTGAGKSMLTKDILFQEYITGTKIIVIDIEREYLNLAEKFSGDVINLAGGEFAINPFEIFLTRGTNADDNEEENELNVSNIPPLSLHIKHLEKFFSCYAELDKYQKSVMSEMLLKFYEAHGMRIDMTLEELKMFPQLFLKDFYIFLGQEKETEDDTFRKDIMNKIHTIIYPICAGSDAHIWNAESKFDILSNFTVFDIYELRNLDIRILSTQYLLLMERIWHEAVMNRESNVRKDIAQRNFLRIVCDELHKILNTRIIAEEFKNLSKMIRKYDGGLMTITQSTTDYLKSGIDEEGKAILNSAIYKFVFAQNSQGLHDSKIIFDLNQEEVELLSSADQRNCLATFGKYKTQLINEIPDFILQTIS